MCAEKVKGRIRKKEVKNCVIGEKKAVEFLYSILSFSFLLNKDDLLTFWYTQLPATTAAAAVLNFEKINFLKQKEKF